MLCSRTVQSVFIGFNPDVVARLIFEGGQFLYKKSGSVFEVSRFFFPHSLDVPDIRNQRFNQRDILRVQFNHLASAGIGIVVPGFLLGAFEQLFAIGE